MSLSRFQCVSVQQNQNQKPQTKAEANNQTNQNLRCVASRRVGRCVCEICRQWEEDLTKISFNKVKKQTNKGNTIKKHFAGKKK